LASSGIFFELLVLGSLVGSFAFAHSLDIVASMVRSQKTDGRSAENYSLSAWIFYISRIFIMIAVTALSLLTEGKYSVLSAPQVLTCALLGSVIFATGAVVSRNFATTILRIIRPLVILSFPSFSPEQYWRRVSIRITDRLAFAAAASTFILMIAAILPFVLADLIPKYRMTSVYIGQLANFFATIVVMTYQDPVLSRYIDVGREEEALSHLVSGKLLGLVLSTSVITLFVILQLITNNS
jgi:hypothetical protein